METTADAWLDAPLPCDERTGWSRRFCRAMRRVMAVAGRGGSWGVPF